MRNKCCLVVRMRSNLLNMMFGHRRHDDLPELPLLLLPGLHVEVVAVHSVVKLLGRTPLYVETVVSWARQVGDQRPGGNKFRQGLCHSYRG